MSAARQEEAPARLRSTAQWAARRVSVNCGPDLGRQLDRIAAEYGVALGMVARYAIEAGLKSARRRLARETGR